jgi:hypothetical protein
MESSSELFEKLRRINQLLEEATILSKTSFTIPLQVNEGNGKHEIFNSSGEAICSLRLCK